MYFAFYGKVDIGLKREVLVAAEDDTEVFCPVEVLEDMTRCPNVARRWRMLMFCKDGGDCCKIRPGGLRKPVQGTNYAT